MTITRSTRQENLDYLENFDPLPTAEEIAAPFIEGLRILHNLVSPRVTTLADLVETEWDRIGPEAEAVAAIWREVTERVSLAATSCTDGYEGPSRVGDAMRQVIEGVGKGNDLLVALRSRDETIWVY